ncbi:hypothetical protein [Sphingosinicella sp. YJ22]|uniref:hypothetical protein n=1 Tax=Sphingosinicella sp. YJ22 TaxID=1104780 RepID=UPI00140BC9FC|nr:hypothetical protein [Sphingosinicella sp. YJ22]
MIVLDQSKRLLLLIISVVAVACTPLIADYSLESYRYATELKAETLAMMAKATEPYESHEDEVERLRVRLSSAREFAAGMPRNRLSAAQWDILLNPQGNLAGGFFERWKRERTLGATFVDEARRQTSGAFDDIICLEANKGKDTDC